ncbi:YifB family Mg chelatase-like AAA ATPase [Niveibacterium umoris]|uniref:Magnesium chelatase family protein n=1 Tax=Niveibacterium umoris TaxID=1193620 RepID=A0A840BL78_9RHOO|nr:YifB family Mg chelatase-like AAA ATPase [Niveibacterium umoris]MBB4013760.1 magnesium chelatase family protein [Niveibacterium umoris]
MSLACVVSRALDGIAAPEVVAEVHLANGLPGFSLVGLPEAEVRESRDRVRAALQTCQFEFPQRRITANLAPADLPKEGGRFDLPIALGILAASGQIRGGALEGIEFAGELSLDGRLRPVRGALAMALAATRAGRRLVLPEANAGEAALVDGAGVFAARSLLEVVAHLNGQTLLDPVSASDAVRTTPNYPDLADVRGQQSAKRALEIAAAGRHSLLFFGPPGSGKSMLAHRLPGVLPPMTDAEALEAAAVQSIDGGFDPARWGVRPVRSPHHSASAAALVGGGASPRPGEISLAHHGILFLDELPEFDRRVLESLREPLETGHITVSRAARRADFPARFQLVAAMNPCPCGHYGSASGRCRCTPDQVARYRGRLSGPLLDRIDMVLEVAAVPAADLQAAKPGEPSAEVRRRVAHADTRQQHRQGKPNAALAAAEVERHCTPDEAGARLLAGAIARLGLSARGTHRVLRVARTIADLAGSDGIGAGHVAEAVQLRRSLPVPV